MSDEGMEFLSYEEAQKIVGNVVEEEHLKEANRRILTVYDPKGKELCWFDAEEVMESVGGTNAKTDVAREEAKIAAVEYIMRHIPVWARDI